MMHLLFINATAQRIISAFSWMLIHSLWQGLALSAIAAVLLMINKKASPAFRYNLALGLFLMFTMGCAITFMWEWDAAESIASPLTGALNATVLFSNTGNINHIVSLFNNYLSANAPLIVLCWFVMFSFKSMRMISAMVYNHRIKSRYVYQPAQQWISLVEQLCDKLNITKKVVLLGSGYIKMPVVIGHLKPVVLMPMGLLAGMPSAQVEAILLHELAHIRRNDYFVNFLQNIAEAVFFFNPALLWISSQLREERENCCDDIALEHTNDKRGFVQALITFKEHELYGGTYATTFAGKKGHLLRRVSRILGNTNKTLGIGEKVFFMASVLTLAVLVTTTTIAQVKQVPKKDTVKKTAKPAVVKQTTKPAKKAATKTTTITAKGKNGTIYTNKYKGADSIQRRHEAEVREKEAVHRQAEAEVRQKEAVNRQVEAEVREKEAVHRQAEAQVRQKEAVNRQAEAEVRQKEAVTRQAEAEVRQKEAATRQREAKVRQKEAVTHQAEAEVRQKEAVKRQAEAEVRQKEAVTRQHEAEVRQKEEVIRQREQEVKQKEADNHPTAAAVDARFKEVDRLYKDYQAELAVMTPDVKKRREAEIVKLETQVKDMQQKILKNNIKPMPNDTIHKL